MRECGLCGEKRTENRLKYEGHGLWTCIWETGCQHRVRKLDLIIETLARGMEDLARMTEEN